MKRTPFYHAQVKDGAKMGPRGEWELPAEYVGPVIEHKATRETCALYDITTMGEIEVTGKDAKNFVNRLMVNDLNRIGDGQIIYTSMLNDNGGIIDDLTVYRMAEDKYMLVTGSGGRLKLMNWLPSQVKPGECAHITDVSSQYGFLSLQGPKSRDILRPITDANLDTLKYFQFTNAKVGNVPVILSRTGYTGELGYEFYVAPESGEDLWNALMEAGKPHGLTPAGMGALVTTRLEKRYLLGGFEFDENTTPLEAGLGWTVRMDKPDFVGKAVLQKQKSEGLKRKIAGLRISGSKVPAKDAEVLKDGQVVGKITSACMGHSVGDVIAMAFVPPALTEAGNQLQVKIDGDLASAQTVKGAFWDPANDRVRS